MLILSQLLVPDNARQAFFSQFWSKLEFSVLIFSSLPGRFFCFLEILSTNSIRRSKSEVEKDSTRSLWYLYLGFVHDEFKREFVSGRWKKFPSTGFWATNVALFVQRCLNEYPTWTATWKFIGGKESSRVTSVDRVSNTNMC